MYVPKRAQALLQSLRVDDPAEIDLEAIAWLEGAKVKYRSLDGCEARIVGQGDRAIISINSSSTEPRQRFSLAHEIGHWEWHRGEILMCQAENIGGGNRKPPKEAAADRFAADLLMPDFLLRESLKRDRRRLDLKLIESIAGDYKVSRSASAIRLVEKEVEPSILVCHGPSGRKWFVRSPSVGARWFPKEDLDADSSAMGVLFGGDADDRFLTTIGADAWFDRHGADRLEIKEQSFRVVANEVLTLLVISDEAMLAD